MPTLPTSVRQATERVDVCCVLTEALAQASIDHATTLLSSDERVRHAQLIAEADRRDFAVAHALLRRVLVRHSRRLPGRWGVGQLAHGKPVIVDMDGTPYEALSFNVSHTPGCVACVVGVDACVGVDVVRVRALPSASLVHDVCGAPMEQAALAHADDREREIVFAEIWGLKEAFLKAVGVGWAVPVPQLAFDVRRPRAIGFTPPSAYADRTWHCAVWAPGPRLRLAVVVGSPNAGPTEIAVQSTGAGRVDMRTSDDVIVSGRAE